MPIDCTQHSDQFGGFFKSAAVVSFAGCPEHGVPLRQLLKVQLASFSKQVGIRGPEVVLHDASATCLAALINELAVNPPSAERYPTPQVECHFSGSSTSRTSLLPSAFDGRKLDGRMLFRQSRLGSAERTSKHWRQVSRNSESIIPRAH